MSSPTGIALAIELTAIGAAMREQRFRREHPDAGDDEIKDFMHRWMLYRPGAPHGDADGVPSDRFS